MASNKSGISEFIERWTGKGDEKQDTQRFWIDFLHFVLGLEHPTSVIEFEKRVKLEDSTRFIDAYIPQTKVIIEQKSLGVDLSRAEHQSGGDSLTPYHQAKRYNDNLPADEKARWIVCCNFERFEVHDMNKPLDAPVVIELADLENEHYRLQFLVDAGNVHLQKEMEVSLKAGEIIGEIYDELLKQYVDPNNPDTLKSLNVLCVRLVFCLYAEDAGLFGEKRCMFHDYLAQFKPGEGDMRRGLIDLFEILNTPVDKRSPYTPNALKAFPYCNGGLFSDREIEIPFFNDRIAHLILKNASDDFDWSQISPTIFGAVFESTLNPETRRSGGMHYTSIENIHKVIDPLFLDDLKEELSEIKSEPIEKKRVQLAKEFQDKLASLKFLDPACGSGNFLTETYLSLRRLENEVMPFINDLFNPIKVDIHQFYGIEINDFAVATATTALWIAEAQMMAETERMMHIDLDFLPLKSYNNIKEGNALRMDWNDVVPANEINYIMGNPPFVGFTYMSAEQKSDMNLVFPGIKNLDFVACWYKRASDYIQNTSIECGFVSTNSIVQGETIGRLWPLLNIKINYAYQTFVWNSEASIKAHVHCVIIGFAAFDRQEKFLFSPKRAMVKNINGYLIEGDDIVVQSRNTPVCNVPGMIYGNKPADGGNLIIEEEDYIPFITAEPSAQKWIRPLLGAAEYLNNRKRYCLWLTGISPAEIKAMPHVMERVRRCKEMREASIADAIRKFAETPHLFAQRTQPEDADYIIVPLTTGETRRYIPIGFLSSFIKTTNACSIIPYATLFHFGILTSIIHMAWMRTVCGRLEMRYRYSKDIVYNNFPWPTPTVEQKNKIEKTAQAILDARNLYPDCSLADLYDELTMPIELRKAHQSNDKAVMDAYGFPQSMTEEQIVAELFNMYQRLVEPSNSSPDLSSHRVGVKGDLPHG